MAEKKTQHFIPRIYLAPFLDRRPPSGWPEDRPFEPTVWISHPLDLVGFRRKAPANILARTRLYNLSADDPKRPWLEESLSRIESAYAVVRGLLESESPLSVEQYGTLLIFIGGLSGRTPQAIDHRQSFVDDLERIHRGVVQGHQEAEADADHLFANADEGGKLLLPTWIQAYAKAVGRNGFILINESKMDFITSDNPVCHVFSHVDENPVAAFPPERRIDAPRSVQAHFCFTPLTPHLAFISSPLLCRGDDLYCRTDDIALIFSLNQLARSMAQDWIISPSERPYGDLTDAVIAADTEVIATPRSGLHVYTQENRYWLSSKDVLYESGAHPLVSKLTFSTPDMAVLRNLAREEKIYEVTAYDGGRAVSHLKHARLTHIAESAESRSTIETNLEDMAAGWPSRRTNPSND